MDAMDDDWDIDTLMNCTTISAVAQIHLRKVYLSLFCILVAAAFGAYCYQLWNIGGLVTRLAFIVALACFVLTKTWTRWKRVAVLIVAAFCGGAFVGPLINLIVMTDTGVIVSTIGAIAVAYGCFSVVVMLTLRRCYIYLGSLIFSSVLIRIWLHFASIVFGGYTAFWEIKLYLLAIIYIVGVVVYSQVMIEQADQFRDIDYVDHVLDITVYFAGLLIVIVLMLLRKASKFGKGKKKEKLN